MRIILIGATGTIGRAIAQSLSEAHEVVRVSRTSGDLHADIADSGSVRALFTSAAPFDAVVCAAGQAAFRPLADLSDEEFGLGLSSKLMGQVNLVRLGLPHITDGGSFTLTSGILSQHPMPGSASISLVNAGLEGFVRAAALELPRGIRVNVVSPPWVSETLEAMGRDPSAGLPASVVARAYRASVEGEMNGEVLAARDYA
ncbi:MAG: short chain dehydrogenase [Chromatiaceae bacterium]|jgi:NAD(P)-dependent dehydrogenase (short-subunit alcohol dehydrogenase family)